MSGLEHVEMETNAGTIVLALDSKNAPISTENFLQYVDDEFYDGTIFHRVIDGFMIQGGGFIDGLEQKQTRSPIKNEWQNGLKNNRGTIAMARTNAPDSATSQFYINVKDNPNLDRPRAGAAYAVFGSVVGGMDVVDAIRVVETGTLVPDAGGRGMQDVPLDTVEIVSARRLSADEAKHTLSMLDEKNADAIRAWKAAAAERNAAKQEALKAAAQASVEAAENVIEDFGVDISKAYRLESGLWLLDSKLGALQTEPVKAGGNVSCHYDVWLSDGTPVQSSRDDGRIARFNLSGVVDAWKQGVPGMKKGAVRWMIAPPYLAYGAQGKPRIPANSTLIFKIELIENMDAPSPSENR